MKKSTCVRCGKKRDLGEKGGACLCWQCIFIGDDWGNVIKSWKSKDWERALDLQKRKPGFKSLEELKKVCLGK